MRDEHSIELGPQRTAMDRDGCTVFISTVNTLDGIGIMVIGETMEDE